MGSLSPSSRQSVSRQGERIRDGAEGMVWDPSATYPDHKDDSTTSDRSNMEKGTERERRAHLFLGKPMSVAHEVAFFAVVSTANFTPRE